MTPRLIIHAPACGARNMAVDEALLASAASGSPTLRIYGWQPATLSLGYFQSAAERNDHQPSRACPVVRRASGGGAILHDCELTYSLTMSCQDRFGSQAEEVYRRVHRSLIETFSTWEVTASLYGDQPQRQSQLPSEPFLCFQRRSAEDIVVHGSKIVGSAQRRHQGAILQHGSVLLGRSSFAPELPGLAEVTSKLIQPITFEELVARWLPRLQAALSLVFAAGSLTDEEEQAAVLWETERFATDAWTNKR